MYCRNCGKELLPNANVCTQCGVPAGQGDHFCPNCGAEVNALAVVCVKCGVALKPVSGPRYYTVNGVQYPQKSKLVAGLLGVLIGALGIHNFYLGNTNRGIAQILLTTVGSLACGLGPLAAWIWGLVEGIQIFTGTIHQDSNGCELGE